MRPTCWDLSQLGVAILNCGNARKILAKPRTKKGRDEQHPSRCWGSQVRGTDCDKHVGHLSHERRVPQVSVGGKGLGLGSAEPSVGSGQWAVESACRLEEEVVAYKTAWLPFCSRESERSER